MKTKLHHPVAPLLFAFLGILCGHTSGAEAPPLKTEHFDRDPGWDHSNNRIEASDPPTVKQDLGWSPGRIGGTVWRSTTPAWYGLALERPLSFKDAFSASGKIAMSRAPYGRGAAYLGFFNHERQGWRPWSSMAMRLGDNGDKTFIFVDYMTGQWNAGAAETEVTIPTDGSEHAWRLTYDPNATRAPWTDLRLHSYLATGRQTIEHTLEKARKVEPELTREALEQRLKAALALGLVTYLKRHGEHIWQLKQEGESLRGAVTVQLDGGQEFRSYLPAAMRDTPVVLDRFGIFNFQNNHGAVRFQVSDLAVNGRKIDLSNDPGWTAQGNRAEFLERDFVARQNFGYSAESQHAGGGKGEVGGKFYNVEPFDPKHGYYADEIGHLTLDDPIRFSGKISFIEGGTDAGMFFGFFRAEDEKKVLPSNKVLLKGGWPQANTLGVVIDGPARVGWYFSPVVTAADRKLSVHKSGTIFLPTRAHCTFDFIYDPQANNGVGRITATLDGQPPILLDLTREQRKAGATFDRFGLTSFRWGGKYSVLYFDDLTYTTGRPADAPPVWHEQKITTVPYPR